MNDTGRLLFLLHVGEPREDSSRADAWRRLHARPDAPPLPIVEQRQRRTFAVIRRPLATVLRILPRHA